MFGERVQIWSVFLVSALPVFAVPLRSALQLCADN